MTVKFEQGGYRIARRQNRIVFREYRWQRQGEKPTRSVILSSSKFASAIFLAAGIVSILGVNQKI
jgi:hypothetical protein